MKSRTSSLIAVLALVAAVACVPADEPTGDRLETIPKPDPHSYARPQEVRVSRLALDLTVDFENRRLDGTSAVEIEGDGDELVLDTRGLTIHAVILDDGEPADFALGPEDERLGRALTIGLRPETRAVAIRYTTAPQAAALQWLEPRQTAGGEAPFLFTQSQAILARTWVPCQDTPEVRFTYDATIRVPQGLLALMSAENPAEKTADGVYHFSMSQPIPSYLLALAVGDLEFRALGPRSGVYAEPPVVEAAASEFAEVEEMMAAAEKLYGPYKWDRYDLLVLPPSFPYGGMENPRLTFVTPTILAGDRSLVSLVAHELAHSWSGNLVTNATWNDFWLNEGFTSYLENRLMEELHGEEYAEMLAALGRQDLEATLAEMGPAAPDSHLLLDLEGRDPDDGMTDVAYEKGAALLHTLEEGLGRERFDEFLRGYFDRFAFRSVDTATFTAHLESRLLAEHPELADRLDLEAWIHGPGLPPGAAAATSQAFAGVESQLQAWRDGRELGRLRTEEWTTHHWLHFLRSLPEETTAAEMAELDATFGFTSSGNSEILAAWLTRAVRHGYRPADEALERFLTTVGRRKFLRPLYRELAASEEGLERARRIYARARPGYHSITRGTLDEILGWSEDSESAAG